MIYISELEINTSNICGARCFICSPHHGSGNVPLMPMSVFNRMIERLHEVKVGCFQTSGNGECLLNPNYLDMLCILKKEFPDTPRWCYNNFSMMTPEISEQIIEEQLIDKMHVRIESMNPETMEKASRLNPNVIYDNLQKFYLMNRGRVQVTILYNCVTDYIQRCKNVLGKSPAYWPYTNDEVAELPVLNDADEEMEEIKKHFQQFSTQPIDIFRIGHSLWAERETAEPDYHTPCPKLPVIENVLWIHPDGRTSCCCYDDRQTDFDCGSILHQSIAKIWEGEVRKNIISNIKVGTYLGNYPCVNANCCKMGD